MEPMSNPYTPSTPLSPVCLIIMDGLAYGSHGQSCYKDAVFSAETPNLDKIWNTYPHAMLEASGEAVGLPEGQMGNSEVGHLNIGAGRTVFQDLSRIDNAIKDESFFQNRVLVEAIDKAVATNRAVHFMGLLSNGGVHSSQEHLYALLKLAKMRGAKDVHIHGFLDGRDTPPTSAINFVQELQDTCIQLRVGQIASLMGRYYAMDRDRRYDRVQKAYDCMTLAKAKQSEDPIKAVRDSYDAGVNDEFMLPTTITGRKVEDGDTLIFFNFRPDRAREISYAFTSDDFSEFDREARPDISFVCFTEYDPKIEAPVAFEKELPKQVLADVLAENELRQLHIAETEKYAHVTFFFNGGVEEEKHLETRILIPSPKVATYDLKPEMSAPIVGARLVEEIKKDSADVYIVNFANGDMVGHTGVMDAATKAVEVVDEQVGAVVDAILAKGGSIIITADHGNAEQMTEENSSESFTAHTCNRVPIMVVGSGATEVKNGSLADIAPTLLALLNIEAPELMTGKNLMVY